MATVVLVRPGCTDFDDQNRIQGALDLPLNRRGEDQLQSILQSLETVPVEVVYTAPREPARSTADAIGSLLGVPIKEKEDLRNVDQGLWQGLPVQEVRRKYPKVFRQWQESPESICPPQGETIAEVTERIRKVLQKPLKRKLAIAVVASEPLATIIRGVVTGSKPEFTSPTGCTGDAALVEVIQTNGKPACDSSPQQPVTGSVAGSGISTRGDSTDEFCPET